MISRKAVAGTTISALAAFDTGFIANTLGAPIPVSVTMGAGILMGAALGAYVAPWLVTLIIRLWCRRHGVLPPVVPFRRDTRRALTVLVIVVAGVAAGNLWDDGGHIGHAAWSTLTSLSIIGVGGVFACLVAARFTIRRRYRSGRVDA